ncbi:MAG TPA: hypothetical protein VD927_06690 [Chryseosolibacter sp.]|nr:hypothetical protein [Chryseosolibacter sp.]
MATIEQVAAEKRKEFNEIFEQEYEKGVNMVDAYDEAEKRFIEKYNHRAYSNYQSFNSAKFNRAKRELQKK